MQWNRPSLHTIPIGISPRIYYRVCCDLYPMQIAAIPTSGIVRICIVCRSSTSPLFLVVVCVVISMLCRLLRFPTSGIVPVCVVCRSVSSHVIWLRCVVACVVISILWRLLRFQSVESFPSALYAGESVPSAHDLNTVRVVISILCRSLPSVSFVVCRSPGKQWVPC